VLLIKVDQSEILLSKALNALYIKIFARCKRAFVEVVRFNCLKIRNSTVGEKRGYKLLKINTSRKSQIRLAKVAI